MAAVVGDDPALAAELRAVFVDSAHGALTGLRAASCEADWVQAAQRARGLAGSFGAVRLMAAADEAMRGPAGDPAILRRIERLISAF